MMMRATVHREPWLSVLFLVTVDIKAGHLTSCTVCWETGIRISEKSCTASYNEPVESRIL